MEYLNTVDDKVFEKWVKDAVSSSHVTLDLSSRLGPAVIDLYTNSEDEHVHTIKSLCDLAPDRLHEAAKFRLTNLILGHLVEKGNITLPKEKDPRVLQAEIDESMKELIAGIKTQEEMKNGGQVFKRKMKTLNITNTGKKARIETEGTLVSKASKIKWMDGFMTDLTVTEIDKQKVENKVAKIWDEDMANKYFIAKVFGIDITYGDINSLKDSNWLTDKVMDAYLTYIAQTEMDKGNIKVRHQLVSSTNNIINGRYVPGRHEKNKLIPYDFVIGAYHERGGHWDLLIVEPSKGKVVFLNPLGETAYQKRTVLLHWRKYIGQMLLLHPENGYKNWTLEVPDHSKQLDGSSCGIYCLLFAEKYLAGESLLGITQEEVNNKRADIAHTLMMFEGHMAGCCPCCGFQTNVNEEQLIQCTICKNWFHKKTHCVGEAFAAKTSNEEFVCEIDRTTEKE
ncbi:sentrin-specific protease 2-like [Mytilus californianus]|uniref:sentrin-specific protease 2-like n=1 Tax=Mytilus californianus TaxID=6549 RepID=UPI002247941A|nr:sentrin-specific protease 2-like [Mytilus californianus]